MHHLGDARPSDLVIHFSFLKSANEDNSFFISYSSLYRPIEITWSPVAEKTARTRSIHDSIYLIYLKTLHHDWMAHFKRNLLT